MKPIISIILSFSSLFLVSKEGYNETTFKISEESRLNIIGFTNINSFSCNYNTYKLNHEQKVFYKREGDKILFTDTSLNLKSIAFDCGSKGINKDLNKLLETETYPDISLKLKEISTKNKNEGFVNTSVDVTICGKTKSYLVPVEISGLEKLSVKGILKINLHDFDLNPPKKALGIIKVKEEINIDFNLFFQKL